ncbi:MAG: GNAT family N-acetyltransferase [Nocardioidaceae bacterium]
MSAIDVRPMKHPDIDGVAAVVEAAGKEADRRAGRPPEERTPEQRQAFARGMQRFVDRDPAGAWVAVDGDTVVGMAEAIRRDSFWGLSMLFVHPAQQSKGLGRQLLDATISYADGAEVRMILTSPDPRALRRYSQAGLAIHPAVEAEGVVDRTQIPTGLPGRSGDSSDLDLVAEVDAGLRGSRAEDVGFLVGDGAGLEIVDHRGGRGFAVHRRNRLSMLGATDDATAAMLLWRVLAQTEGTAEVWGMTAGQDWAVKVVLAARMKVSGAGPLFVDGRERPPGPWLPSGWYF